MAPKLRSGWNNILFSFHYKKCPKFRYIFKNLSQNYYQKILVKQTNNLIIHNYRFYKNKRQKMINPVRALKGKLNYLKIPNSHLYKVIQLANSIPNNQKSSLDSVSIQQIKNLKNNQTFSSKQFYKFLFQLQCHDQNRLGTIPNSIYQDLIPQQKKVVSLLTKFTSLLNSRQISYLNLQVREKLNSKIPHWENLHLNNDSPSKRDILILPTLKKAGLVFQIKILSKKNVSKLIKTFHEQTAK